MGIRLNLRVDAFLRAGILGIMEIWLSISGYVELKSPA